MDSENDTVPTTVVDAKNVKLGDFLMLQNRPCQVIRINQSSTTGQSKYLGVDIFTKQLHEESSQPSKSSEGEDTQTIKAPVFKNYKVLDMADGYVTVMTESGDVKQGLAVVDQSNLWTRLRQAFEAGKGSVSVRVLEDSGREMAVEMDVK